MDIRVLGPVGLRDGDEEIPIGGPRQRRLLAALVANAGKVVSVDRLVDAVWNGDEPPEGGAKTLRTYVSRLRVALGDGHLRHDEPGYSLVIDGDLIDAKRFERLATAARARLDAGDTEAAKERFDEALALWSGPAYDEFASEGWVWAEAARLEELRLVAREDRAEALLAGGRTAEAIAELERLTTEFPLREHAQQKLLVALYRDGRQADALRAFQKHREHLVEQVGLDPSPAIVEIERMIATRDPRLDEVPAPRALRGYQLGEKLGEGRFGVVYRAIQPTVDRDVAIKMIHPDLADDPAFVRRFESEAQLVARLEHRYIVPLYDYWREPGGAYLVMRWMRGGTLDDRVAAGPLSLPKTIEVVEQIGGALAAAHHAGVIHRDLKPGNLLLDEEGNAYLTDFGIAVANVTGSVVQDLPSAGSPAYASPEQMTGGDVSVRSDIYALGVIVYELLTGQLPYRSQTTTGLVGEKLARPVPGLSAQRGDLPPAIDTVVQKATLPDPADRYGSAVEFVDALRTAASTAGRVATTGDALASPASVHPPQRAVGATLLTTAGPTANPYKGLRAFDEADAADFFGRDRMVEQVLTRLREGARFVAVVGPSGSGKSSLVLAGVVPQLVDGALDGSDQWFVTTMSPGRHPYEELESALLRVAINPPATLLDQLKDGERGLVRAVQRTLPSGSTELLLVLDQFEELFTQAQPDERERFLAALALAAHDTSARMRILVTIRADYFDRPLASPAIGELMATHSIAITPLSAEEIERAVAGPAERSGVRLEPGLLATVVGDVAEHPAALPFLQYCLTELYDRRDGLVMTLDAYRDLGGVSGALGRRAEDTYDALDDAGKTAARDLFTRLVTPGRGEADTRRRARRAELVALPVGGAVMNEVIDGFGQQRLLTFDRDPATREPTVEVAHEALLDAWPRFCDWIEQDREGLTVMRGIAEASDAWADGGHEDGDLLRGGRLETAESWVHENPGRLSTEEERFVADSVTAREATLAKEVRTTRRLRRLVAVVAAALVVALVAGGVAWTQRNEADDQRDTAQAQAQLANEAARNDAITRMAFQARALRESDQPQALLLALEAERLRSDPDTLGALQVALLGRPNVLRTLHTGIPLTNITVTPDGRYLVAGTLDGRVVTIDLANGNLVDAWKVSDRPVVGLRGAKGELIAFAFGDSLVVARDSDGSTRALLADGATPSPNSFIPAATYVGPDGNTNFALATTTGIRLVRHSGEVVGEVPTSGAVGWLSWSTDGRTLAIGQAAATLTSPTEVRLVDPSSGTDVAPVLTLPWPALFALDATGDRLAAGSLTGGESLLIDLATREPIGEKLDVNVTSLAFSGDSRLMATTSARGVTKVLATSTGRQVGPDLMSAPGQRAGVAFDAQGDTVFVAGQNGDIVIHGVSGGTKIAKPLGIPGWLVYPSRDTEFVAIPSIPTDDEIRIVEVETGDVVHTLRPTKPYVNYPLAGVLPASFSPDGREVAIGSEATTGSPATIEIFDLATGSSRSLVVSGELNIGLPLRWSPDGTRLAAGTFDRVLVLDAETGERLQTLAVEIHLPTNLVYDERGRLLVTALSGKTIIFDEEGARLATYGEPLAPQNGSWAPDGSLVLTNSITGEVRLVDAGTGESVAPSFTAGSPLSAQVGANGIGAAITWNNIVTLWDVATGQQIGEPFNPSDATVYSTIVDASGTHLVSGGTNSVVWDIDPAVWRARACEAAGRNLTQAEWDEFLPEGEPYHATCPQYG